MGFEILLGREMRNGCFSFHQIAVSDFGTNSPLLSYRFVVKYATQRNAILRNIRNAMYAIYAILAAVNL